MIPFNNAGFLRRQQLLLGVRPPRRRADHAVQLAGSHAARTELHISSMTDFGPITIRGSFDSSSQRTSFCIRFRLTETQPAVAPLPLTCRKMAPPRRVSAGWRRRTAWSRRSSALPRAGCSRARRCSDTHRHPSAPAARPWSVARRRASTVSAGRRCTSTGRACRRATSHSCQTEYKNPVWSRDPSVSRTPRASGTSRPESSRCPGSAQRLAPGRRTPAGRARARTAGRQWPCLSWR